MDTLANQPVVKLPCEHKSFNNDTNVGIGWIRCADCGKEIPTPVAIVTLQHRLGIVEHYMQVISRRFATGE